MPIDTAKQKFDRNASRKLALAKSASQMYYRKLASSQTLSDQQCEVCKQSSEPMATLKSSTATQSLADPICNGAPDCLIGPAPELWCASASMDDLLARLASTRSWQRPLDEARRAAVVERYTTQPDIARFHPASTSQSAALYRGLQNGRDGTRLSNIELSVAIGLRLGLAVAAPGIC